MLILAANAPAPTVLHLKLEGLRSSKGSVRLCIWRDAEAYPDCARSSSALRQVAPAKAVVDIDIVLPADGDYGISAIHDENDNNRLDKSFIGMPTEGVAFSNDAKIRFGPPKFDKVRFAVAGEASHTMHMRYFL